MDELDKYDMQDDSEMSEIYASIYYTSSEEYPNQWADEEAFAYNYGLDEEDEKW